MVPANDSFKYREELRRYPFTRYAVSAWAHHARMTVDTTLMETLMSFLNSKNNVGRAIRLEPTVGRYSRAEASSPFSLSVMIAEALPMLLDWNSIYLSKDLSAIHIAAMYGLTHAMQRLLDEGTSAELGNSRGETPLF